MLIKLCNFLLPIFFVIAFFCGSIVVHELGHYIAARLRGLYIPRFSIGFGPRLFSKKIGNTEFCLSLLPLGGYVALPQLADLNEIEGKYDIPSNAKPITCADKIIVAAMGAVANIIFALIIGLVVWFTGIPTDSGMMSRTIGYVENELILDDGGVINSPAKQAGLLNGDEIIAIDGAAVNDFNDIQQFLALGTKKNETGQAYSEIRFLRDGREYVVTVFPVLLGDRSGADEYRRIGIMPKQDLVVHSVYSDENDIQAGDQIVSIDDVSVFSSFSLQDCIAGKESVNVGIIRSGKFLNKRVNISHIVDIKPYIHLKFSDGEAEIIPNYQGLTAQDEITEHTNSKLCLSVYEDEFLRKYGLTDDLELHEVNGFQCENLADVCEKVNINKENLFTFFRHDKPLTIKFPNIQSVELIPAVYRDVLGVNLKNNFVLVHKSPFALVGESVSTTFKTLHGLFSHHSDVSVRNLMGPAGLIRTMHICSTSDLRLFLWFVILINVNLAILNMLPLPILDGGCIVLAVFEKMFNRRRKAIDKIFGALQSVFLFILLGLLIYVSFFDIKRWQSDRSVRKDMTNQLVRQVKLRM